MGFEILTTEVSDAASVEASVSAGDAEEANLPALNVLEEQPADCWRCTGTDPVLTFGLAAASPVQSVWIGYHNATDPAAVVTWKAAATEGGLAAAPDLLSSTLVQQAFVRGYTRSHALLRLDAPVAYPWHRLTFSTAGAAYLDVGRVGMGVPWRTSRGPDFGAEISLVEPSGRRRAVGGAVYAQRAGKFREMRITVSHVPEDEAHAVLMPLDRIVGTSVPVVGMLDPDHTTWHVDRTVYGFLTGVEPVTYERAGKRLLSKSYLIEEMELP